MKIKEIFFLIGFIVLCFLTYSSSVGTVSAQKKPTALKLDVDIDDLQLCETNGKGDLNGSQFCALFRSYYSNKNSNNFEAAQADRNEMIDLVSGQVDTYYKLRKDGRRSKIRWFQTLLDFLEIGAATAITITNGARPKTVIGAALNGFQGGRTAFNKNFEILQTQVLINTMNTNRAKIMTELLRKQDLSIQDYSWYKAKNDLRDYLFAGTFDNALDSLVDKTGADVAEAEKELKEIGDKKLAAAATAQAAASARDARVIKDELRKNLKGTAQQKADALKKIQAIVAELEADDAIQKLLEEKGIASNGQNGEEILNKLRDLLIEQTRNGRVGRDNIAKINQAFINSEKK